MSKHLRAVNDGEKLKQTSVKSITEAAKGGTIREQLVALRDRIAIAVEDPNCPSRELASLSKRLMELTKEIDAIDARDREEGDGIADTPDADWEAV